MSAGHYTYTPAAGVGLGGGVVSDTSGSRWRSVVVVDSREQALRFFAAIAAGESEQDAVCAIDAPVSSSPRGEQP
jgi:hypothetical protein